MNVREQVGADTFRESASALVTLIPDEKKGSSRSCSALFFFSARRRTVLVASFFLFLSLVRLCGVIDWLVGWLAGWLAVVLGIYPVTVVVPVVS